MVDVSVCAESMTGQEWEPQSFALARFSELELVNRDRLVSMMMQDRGVMRILSAPHGYGKTLLAYEYARRVFNAGCVVWIDGQSPEFIRALDNGYLIPEESGRAEEVDLVVVDDLPILDEQRMEVLARCADACLATGTEIVVTTLPSCDYLRSTQPDRVLVTAKDLLVSERDFKASCTRLDGVRREDVQAAWSRVGSAFMGTAPCMVWGHDGQVLLPCLRGFFEESVPLEFLRAALAILILERGRAADLGRLGAQLSEEFSTMAAKDYLFLGFDNIARTFAAGHVPAATIKAAIEEAGVAQALLGGSFPVHEKALGLLLEEGNTERVEEVMSAFCTAEHCAAWLKDCGWDLIDSGATKLAGTLFERANGQALKRDCMLMVMHAWLMGMRGEKREAAYHAREALCLCEGAAPDIESAKVRLGANLALLAFCDAKAADVVGSLDSLPVDEVQIGNSLEFLVAVAALCTPDELERWAAAIHGNFAPASARAKKGTRDDQERLDKMLGLFETYGRRFAHTLAFRVALHMLACVETPKMHGVLHECGTGVLVAMRKRGTCMYSDAIVVGDLWRSGYFGVSSKTVDVKDAKVLSMASALLMKMSREAGREAPAVPWEQASSTYRAPASGKRKGRKPQHSDASEVPVATVSLFGGLEVIVGEKYIPQSRWSKRALQLFAILVMNQGKDVSREVIFQQMWPELSRSRALDNFYTAWSRMQALLGEGPYLSRRGEFCSINPRYVVSDVAEFEQLSRRILLENEDAATLLDVYARMEVVYRGGLLPSENDNAYIREQRRRLRAVFVDAMLAGSSRSLEANDARVALWFARKAMDEDKEREDVYMMLIKAQMAAGQRCSAIRTYFQCRKYLRDELGLDPSAETQMLYDRLIESDPSLLKLTSQPCAQKASMQ